MTALIFLLTLLTLIILFIRVIVKLIRRKPFVPTMKVMMALIIVYVLGWVFFDLSRNLVPVPMGTQICFDDWCATITKAERQASKDSTVIILHIMMTNQARGIAQTPSQPRVHILDMNGHVWPYSVQAQRDYEKQNGTQPGIGHRLELHQSMETVLVFTVPKSADKLKALIEEGPWITNLLFPTNQQVFPL